jgi:hypothetical protein
MSNFHSQLDCESARSHGADHAARAPMRSNAGGLLRSRLWVMNGRKRIFRIESALTPTADIGRRSWQVSSVPDPDIPHHSITSSAVASNDCGPGKL